MSIRSCICNALARPLRKQLYQAPFSKHFLASTIVSGFGDCIWDGSLRMAIKALSGLDLHAVCFDFLVAEMRGKSICERYLHAFFLAE